MPAAPCFFLGNSGGCRVSAPPSYPKQPASPGELNAPGLSTRHGRCPSLFGECLDMQRKTPGHGNDGCQRRTLIELCAPSRNPGTRSDIVGTWKRSCSSLCWPGFRYRSRSRCWSASASSSARARRTRLSLRSTASVEGLRNFFASRHPLRTMGPDQMRIAIKVLIAWVIVGCTLGSSPATGSAT